MAKLSRGFCNRTQKKRFPDVIAAKLALATINRSGNDGKTGKLPTRSYQCEFCNGHHLTSQSKKEYQAMKQEKLAKR